MESNSEGSSSLKIKFGIKYRNEYIQILIGIYQIAKIELSYDNVKSLISVYDFFITYPQSTDNLRDKMQACSGVLTS